MDFEDTKLHQVRGYSVVSYRVGLGFAARLDGEPFGFGGYGRTRDNAVCSLLTQLEDFHYRSKLVDNLLAK